MGSDINGRGLREKHIIEAYKTVLKTGKTTQPRLKEELGISFPAVSSVVDELVECGIFSKQMSTPSGAFRPASMIDIIPDAFFIPVVFMRREGYHFSLFNAKMEKVDMGILPYSEIIPKSDQYVNVPVSNLSTPIIKWTEALMKKFHIADIILCMPAAMSADGSILSAALGITIDSSFIPGLKKATGKDIYLMNNSDAYAYAEKLYQNLPDNYIFLNIGHGVGAGIISGGKILHTYGIRAGEIGHCSIDYNGRPCFCGNRGCLERYIGEDAIRDDAKELTGGKINTFEKVCKAYKSGDREIAALMSEKARLTAVGISNMLSVYPISDIVLGGGVERLGDKFLNEVRENIKQVGFRKVMDDVTVTYTANTIGNGAIGAARYFADNILTFSKMVR